MKRSQHQLAAFIGIVSVLAAIFMWQSQHLLPLYVNAATRAQVKSAMMNVASREGWLLSDMLVTNVTREQIRLMHREHVRGQDPERCFTITLIDSSLQPCGA